MDLLIIGIDGGDERVFQGLGASVINAVIKENHSIGVEEDLWNRGWASILSGYHCRTTGACYEKPKLDGSHLFTQKFGTSDYLANDLVTPLWERLNDIGYRVGFMNIPTTMPAPKVDGFIVSGGGGGSSVSGSATLPEVAYHPDDVGTLLDELNYILDTRFVASGIKDFGKYVDRLEEMQSVRTEAYTNLIDEFHPDVGFIAYRALTSLQYLAMSEIEELLRTGSPQNTHQEDILKLYKSFDRCIGELITEIDPDHVMLVSDHASSPYEHDINPDVLLRNQDLQTTQTESTKIVRNTLQSAGRRIPESIKSVLRSRAKSVTDTVRKRNIDWKNTKAFGARYVPGIYVNDESRFNGPVAEEEIPQLVTRIVEAVNGHPEAKDHDVSAKAYRSKYADAKQEVILPDVWLDIPDSMFIEEKDEFIHRNPAYGPIDSLYKADRDQYTGIKGSGPLLSVDDDLAELVNDGDNHDLTIAYEIVRRFAER